MRKILLASALVFAFGAPAFAGSFIAAGDVNVANTQANSSAGVTGGQETSSKSVAYRGATVGGAISGNTTSVRQTASAKAGPNGSSTNTTSNSSSLGGTVTGGYSTGHSVTISSGDQGSNFQGNSSAKASNTNVGGFVFTKTDRGSYHNNR